MLDSTLTIAAFQLAFLGSIAGLLAGLLGIGGGSVLVPGLFYILSGFGYHDIAMHSAVGTSLITIIFTGTSSAVTHHQHRAVMVNTLTRFIPGIAIGVGCGTFLAKAVSGTTLTLTFAVLQIAFGLYMLIRSNTLALFKAFPSEPWFSLIACINAALATLMGVGGGVQNVLYMSLCNTPLAKAIGTAAALGPIIATLGAIGFFYIGIDHHSLPPYSTGFIHWPSFFCIIITSVIMAPVGAKLAHRLPQKKLKTIFTCFLLAISFKMGLEAIHQYL